MSPRDTGVYGNYDLDMLAGFGDNAKRLGNNDPFGSGGLGNCVLHKSRALKTPFRWPGKKLFAK